MATSLEQRVAQLDSVINRLSKLLSSTSNVDILLGCTTYSLHFLHALLEYVNRVRLQLATSEYIIRLQKTAPLALLPGETLIATIQTSPHSRLLRAEQSSKALASLIDDFRTFTRLWGLIKIWSWGSGIYKSPPKDEVLKAIAWAQVFVNVGYQFLENGAYLASKGVLSINHLRPTGGIGRWYNISSRFWMAHVVLEFVKLARQRSLRAKRGLKTGAEKDVDGKQKVVEEAAWWRSVYVNAAWMPLTVHYSLAGGLIGSEATVAGLGFTASVEALRTAWKATA